LRGVGVTMSLCCTTVVARDDGLQIICLLLGTTAESEHTCNEFSKHFENGGQWNLLGMVLFEL
jgi:hypothetical protein